MPASDLYKAITKSDTEETTLSGTRYDTANTDAAIKRRATIKTSEIWKTVGGARAADAENLRILALTNPQEYAEYKKAAIKSIQTVVETAYISAYNQQKVAGLDKEDCKAAAKRQAMMIKEDQFKTLAIRFPTSDDIISKNQRVKTDTALKY